MFIDSFDVNFKINNFFKDHIKIQNNSKFLYIF